MGLRTLNGAGNEKYYGLARRESGSRQEFLEGIDFGRYSKFIEGVVYFEGKTGGRAMETVCNPESNLGLGIFSTIRVSDYAFKNYSWNEFQNILIPHECLHALQNYSESTAPSGRMIELSFPDGKNIVISEKAIKQEIEAHTNQIRHSTFRECSKDFREGALSWLDLYKNLSLNVKVMDRGNAR